MSGRQQLADPSEVVVPAFGVTAALYDLHVAKNSFDASIIDIVDAETEQAEFDTKQDGRREVHGESALCAADRACADTSACSDVLLAPLGLSFGAQGTFHEAIGEHDGFFSSQRTA